jgi:uncharacterized protein (TIGR01777 family)
VGNDPHDNRWELSMNILLTGASGLVGTELQRSLAGHTLRTLGRGGKGHHADVTWNIERGQLDAASLEGIDAAIHLSGENVGQRWTRKIKQSIYESRGEGTKLLCQALAKLKKRPRVLVCASATGIYGDRGEEVLTENGSGGEGFLATVCRAWEAACQPAIEAGIRVVNMRFGVVLSPRGGALKKLLLPFRLGLGTNLGTGKQYFPWIAIDDAVSAILFALNNDKLSGPANTVAPQAVRNKEFVRTLGKVLLRPTWRFLPWAATALPLWLLLGDMTSEVLLSGQHVVPAKLSAAGFKFAYPDLEDALRHVLKAKGRIELPASGSAALAG